MPVWMGAETGTRGMDGGWGDEKMDLKGVQHWDLLPSTAGQKHCVLWSAPLGHRVPLLPLSSLEGTEEALGIFPALPAMTARCYLVIEGLGFVFFFLPSS